MDIDQPERKTVVRVRFGAVSRGDSIPVGRVALERDTKMDQRGGRGGRIFFFSFFFSKRERRRRTTTSVGERHCRSSDDGVFYFVSKLRRVGDVRRVRPGVFASEAKGESREEEEYEAEAEEEEQQGGGCRGASDERIRCGCFRNHSGPVGNDRVDCERERPVGAESGVFRVRVVVRLVVFREFQRVVRGGGAVCDETKRREASFRGVF